MKVDYHKEFKKQIRKLSPKQQAQFAKRLTLFMQYPEHPFLRVHRLGGEFQDDFSFSVTGDLRAHFRYLSENHILLTKIGTHAQLYE